MKAFLKIIFFVSVLLFQSIALFSQDKVDQCLGKLDRIHKQGRLMFTGKPVPELFLNKKDKVLDLGDYYIQMESIELIYSYQERQLQNKKKHGVKFKCIDEGNCIEYPGEGYQSSVTSFFKTKKDCYDFINAYNELKAALE